MQIVKNWGMKGVKFKNFNLKSVSGVRTIRLSH